MLEMIPYMPPTASHLQWGLVSAGTVPRSGCVTPGDPRIACWRGDIHIPTQHHLPTYLSNVSSSSTQLATYKGHQPTQLPACWVAIQQAQPEVGGTQSSVTSRPP